MTARIIGTAKPPALITAAGLSGTDIWLHDCESICHHQAFVYRGSRYQILLFVY